MLRSTLLATLLFFFACSDGYDGETGKQRGLFSPSEEFNSYWNSGTAELTRYELKQARYGAMHEGEMIVVVVSEPFRTDKQVKSELTPGVKDTPVLKAQLMRRFATGIYDYELTTTSFKPVETDLYRRAPKITGSAVDWCGHAWMQLNLKSGAYLAQVRSYFEAEADENFKIGDAISEDEIWQRIRMHPKFLPVGDTPVIPSLMSARLRHRRLNVETALAETQAYGKLKQTEFSLRYATGTPEERQVSWIFEDTFPHRILEYRETYWDGFGKKQKLTTVARLKKTIRSAYWREHDPEHNKLRKEFGVKGFD
jgi:hypothetical protein